MDGLERYASKCDCLSADLSNGHVIEYNLNAFLLSLLGYICTTMRVRLLCWLGYACTINTILIPPPLPLASSPGSPYKKNQGHGGAWSIKSHYQYPCKRDCLSNQSNNTAPSHCPRILWLSLGQFCSLSIHSNRDYVLINP